jgi:hypothetical protein
MNKEIKTENEFRKFNIINSCKLTGKDLVKLSEHINDVFGNEEYAIKIKSKYEHFVYEAKDFIFFLNIRNLPNVLNELEINIFGNNKNITLFLGVINNYLGVSGSNEAWVLGAYQKLESFFNKKRPWFYSRLTGFIVFFILSGMILFLLGIQIGKNNYYALTFFILFPIFSFYLGYAEILDKIFPYFQLQIRKPDTIITKDNIVILLMILTFLVTTIGVVIQFIKS